MRGNTPVHHVSHGIIEWWTGMDSRHRQGVGVRWGVAGGQGGLKLDWEINLPPPNNPTA